MPEEPGKPVHTIYRGYVERGENRNAAERLWGRIPANMMEAYDALKDIRKKYRAAPEDTEDLKRAMKRQLRGLGILTSRVEENIDRLDHGVVEAGHQPICLGGPSLILNKIAYARSLCDLGRDGFVPLFYIADYDGVQPELLNIRVPSPSLRGLLISYPAGREYENSPIHTLPNPPEGWLRKTVDKIEGNYRELLKGSGPRVKERLLQNLAHALTVLKNAFYSTENVSDWSAKTLGSLLNIEGDLGVPLISPSSPEVRHHFQRGYEQIIAEPNRSGFIEASNKAADLIEEAGYRPQIGRREDDYVPFFLECQTLGCNRRRVEPKYFRERGSSTAAVTGRCLKCGEVYEFSFNATNPDMSDLIDWISPRVDSRQIIVDSVIPVLAHVGGPGETSYYAEVIPGVKPLDVPFPIYLRYTRTFYNTPWNKGYAEALKEKGCVTLIREELFEALGLWVDARNDEDGEKLAVAHLGIRGAIEDTYNWLLDRLQALKSDVDAIKKRLNDTEDRAPLIQEMRRKQRLSREIEKYLSCAFGRFSPERFGQEVSWAWFDLAIVSGLDDLFGVYTRQYNRHAPNSSMYFVNL